MEKQKNYYIYILIFMYIMLFCIQDICLVLNIPLRNYTLLIITFVLLFILGFFYEKFRLNLSWSILSIIIFLIICYLSYIFKSIDKVYALDKLNSVLILTILFSSIAILKLDEFKLKYAIEILIIIYSSLLIIFFIKNKEVLVNLILTNERLGMNNINPIWLARMIASTSLLLILTIKNIIPKIIVVIVSTFLLLATGSKGPILTLIIILLFDYFNNFNKEILIKKLKRILVFLLIILGAYIVLKYIIFKFISINFIIDRLNGEAMLQGSRIDRIIKSLNYFSDNPLIGIGIGNWGYYFIGEFGRNYPHNILLEIISEIGIIGIIPFLIFLIAPFIKLKNNFKKNNSIKIIYYSYVFFIINSFISGDLGFSNKEIFLYGSFLIAFYNYNKTKNVINNE